MEEVFTENLIVAFKFTSKTCICLGALRKIEDRHAEIMLLHDFGVFKKGTIARIPYEEIFAMTQESYEAELQRKKESREKYKDSLRRSNISDTVAGEERWYPSVEKLLECGFHFYDPFFNNIAYVSLFEE